MHVELVRSGGIAGLTLRAALDSAELTPAEAAAVATAMKGAGVPPAPPGRGRDMFWYRFVTLDGSRRHEYTCSEGDLPEALRPLVRRLTEAAQKPGAATPAAPKRDGDGL